MNNIFKTLYSMKDDNNLTTRQKYIVGETLEHIDHMQGGNCKGCEYENEPEPIECLYCSRFHNDKWSIKNG